MFSGEASRTSVHNGRAPAKTPQRRKGTGHSAHTGSAGARANLDTPRQALTSRFETLHAHRLRGVSTERGRVSREVIGPLAREWLVVSCQLSVVRGQLSVVRGQWLERGEGGEPLTPRASNMPAQGGALGCRWHRTERSPVRATPSESRRARAGVDFTTRDCGIASMVDGRAVVSPLQGFVNWGPVSSPGRCPGLTCFRASPWRADS